MNRNEICWLAGLLEGEGCFDTYRNDWKIKSTGEVRKGPEKPRIQLNMNDRDVIERVAQITNIGKVLGPYGTGGYYAWRATADSAVQIMREVFPYMLDRRQSKIREIFSNTGELI